MKIKLFLVLIWQVNIVSAQQTFLVYQYKGSVKLKKDKQNKPLQIGEILNAKDIVWLDKGASLAIICEGYNAFLITKTGTQSLANYLDSCRESSNSLTAEYFKYIWEDLTHSHTTPENNRRKYMQNTGAVVRGCPGISFNPLFDTINNFAGDVKIRWKTTVPKGHSSFVLYDGEKDGRLLFSTAVSSNFVHLDLVKRHKRMNEEVYWNVNINGNEVCERRYIKFWPREEYIILRDSLINGLKKIPDKAELCFATGFLLESKHFIAESRYYYNKAVLLKPGVTRYREALSDVTR